MSTEELNVKQEIMRKIREVGYKRLEEYYGKGVDEKLCQPPFFSPNEIEAIIYDLPLPERN